MAVKSIENLFPLIDDPANIFYSKLKTLFFSLPPSSLHVKALNRIIRKVELTLPFSPHKYVVMEDRRRIPSEVRESPESFNGYVIVRFKKTRLVNSETTTTGAHIPVDEYTLSFRGVEKEIAYLESTDRVVIASVDEGEQRINIGFKVGDRLHSNFRKDGYLGGCLDTIPDFDPVDKTEYKEEYESIYKPVIGREIRFKPVRVNGLDQYGWDLYDIDSNLDTHLIDSSDVDFLEGTTTLKQDSQKSCGYKSVWPICYGPCIDHPVQLTFEQRLTGDSTSIRLIETSYLPEYPKNKRNLAQVNVKIGKTQDLEVGDARGVEVFFDNQGFIFYQNNIGFYDSFYSVFRHITFYHSSGSHDFYGEELFLVLCYLFNINFRHLYTFGSDNINIGQINSVRYFKNPTVFIPSGGRDYTRIGSSSVNTYIPSVINIPSDMSFGDGVPLSEFDKVYFEEPYNDTTSHVSIGQNTNIPLVQNSLICSDGLTSTPIDKFRNANLLFLDYFRDNINRPELLFYLEEMTFKYLDKDTISDFSNFYLYET